MPTSLPLPPRRLPAPLRAAVFGAVLAPVAALAPGSTALADDAHVAAAPAGVRVTIEAEGTDLSGDVLSGRLACKAEVTVVVYKQKGARGGGDDRRFAMDVTGRDGDDWEWDTGNTGTPGRFYARVAASRGCQAAVSGTIRAVRNN